MENGHMTISYYKFAMHNYVTLMNRNIFSIYEFFHYLYEIMNVKSV